MLVEVHEGSFGTHANGHAMVRKNLRARYYWLTMENDCCVHVRKCYKCQRSTIKRLGGTVAILNVGHKHDQGHRTQGFKWASLHISRH